MAATKPRDRCDDFYSIRQQKLDAYIENDLEATDGTFGKIMSGTVRPCLLESGPPAPAS